MALQFVIGPASKDHAQAMSRQIKANLADPKAQVFYLVPNHVKFEAEVSLLKSLKTGTIAAQNRVQTFSFTRMAWYFLRESPIFAQPRLDTASNAMLVARLLHENRDQLRLFGGLANAIGFTTKLASQLTELLNGRIDAQILQQACDDLPGNDRHRAKLQDLVIMLDAYEKAIGPFATNASLLAALSQELQTRDLSHTYFYLDHFNDLAASELNLVETLMQQAAQVTVALTLDDLEPAQTPDLFLPAKRLYQRLISAAKRLDVPVLPAITAADRPLSVGMQAVEQFFIANTKLDPIKFSQPVPDVTLAKADSPYTELRHVAETINIAVHHGARYRDFLVIARHLDPYADVIDPIFAEYQLPVFVDHEHPMQHHPLVALLESLFAIQRHHYQYADVIRLLRTELLIPKDMTPKDFRAAVDVCDNHLLRTGISGSYWTKDQDWQYLRRRASDDGIDLDPEKAVQINVVRRLIQAHVPVLFKQLKEAETGQQAATILYQWLIDMGVVAQLSAWRQADIDAGNLQASQAGEQAWATLVKLLDDYVAILGQTPWDLDQFVEILNAGFESATYTQIPSTLDQVVVSETALTRLNKFKHVFVIGATAAVMPDQVADAGLLSAEDRVALQPRLPETAWLAINGPQVALGDPFINYMGMLAGDTALTMSYPGFGDSENHASPYYSQMLAAMNLTEVTWGQPTPEVAPQGGTPRSLLSDYVAVAQKAREQKRPNLPAAWQQVYPQVRQTPWATLAARLAGSLTYTNDVGALDPDLAKKLYGEHLFVSVSQLETYYRNPYEYFLRYGLRLRVRPEFAMTPADTGSLDHATLDLVFKRLAEQQLRLGDLDAQQLRDLVGEVVDDLVAQPGLEILTTSLQGDYAKRRIQSILVAVLSAIRQQQMAGRFATQKTELPFGGGDRAQQLAPIVLPIGDHRQVSVRGKIDRLDTVNLNGDEYFLVIDYKSSKHVFTPLEAYYGVAMQMLTYIDAVENDLDQKGIANKPAGALYMHMHKKPVPYQPDPDAIHEAHEKAYKLQGLLVLPDDQDQALTLAEQFDAGLANAGFTSNIVQIGTKKNGEFSARTQAISQAALALYLRHNRRAIIQAAQQILAGNIALAPLQFKSEATVITQSDYQAIMLFDPATEHDRYHHVATLDIETIMQNLRKEAQDHA
ncbi:PD-(D/E)XK nuclease family protein [Lacticaseibacillus sp. N501-2]|uniref:PD-(D/E)XK nuclease family protein n=1 Tax=Lacticaseibacillus salsurae TaxID=3367729 RepID=UPI0038B2E094